MQLNKNDHNDAEGLAQIVRTGWYRSVHVQSFEAHRLRALLGASRQLVGMTTQLSNHIRARGPSGERCRTPPWPSCRVAWLGGKESENLVSPQLLAELNRAGCIGSVGLEHDRRQIQSDRANFAHGRLP
jgi:hypothetical protein